MEDRSIFLVFLIRDSASLSLIDCSQQSGTHAGDRHSVPTGVDRLTPIQTLAQRAAKSIMTVGVEGVPR